MFGAKHISVDRVSDDEGRKLCVEVLRQTYEKEKAWVKDADAAVCMQCSKKFTQIKRRHHCRNCGGVFCGKCSSRRVPIARLQITSPVRVCDGCWETLTK